MSSGAGFEPRKKTCYVHFTCTLNAVLVTMMHRRRNSTTAEVHVGVISDFSLQFYYNVNQRSYENNENYQNEDKCAVSWNFDSLAVESASLSILQGFN